MRSVSALLLAPPRETPCVILAHGAGAGMTHPFMQSVAVGLADRSVATLRYQFPYMESGSKRPDAPALAHRTIRAAIACAARRFPGLKLFAGGKSLGARMTSQAQVAAPLPRVCGLAFLGFPLHPAKRPSHERAAHLGAVKIPMLFLQGERDALADPALLRRVMDALGQRAALHVFPDADHSFHVPDRSGRTDAQVMDALLDALADWIMRTARSAP
ncbi:MAG: alpha/beta family hydrolase [Acetobacteraceae bacterium]